ncbi:uncharacterized protein N7496_003953 [Penicillium cataractarum]|uniref:Carboxylic ester hydrolase n=1 Tax=Penicillium cataractarum TaxID=2100454 RepID=A0A9W9SP28_9EURO|nr:uncharacterized protein N7496_003953 [Penicillium cataractarum]KAJ5381525.1 hypothetical protein N7496_003953 [Penicillium cataractarum]
MSSIDHPLLGRIQGNQTNDVIEFLGIPYANVAHRFAPPVPISHQERSPEAIFDATSYGPSVEGKDGCEMDFALIQHTLPRTHFAQSGTESLNLNMTIPRMTKPSEPLPVLVFLHGGGFEVGSSSWPQNRLNRLVSLACELGLPVLGVSINYRVGPAGFLTSMEMRDAGLTSNNGLRDQRVALKWVQHHIRGFGGDPDNVTLVGHSAGGVSAALHLSSEEPLFKRVACLSGHFLAKKPLPSEVHEHIYNECLRILNLETLSASERVSRLLELGADDLENISRFPSSPIVDGEICSEMPSVHAISNTIPTSLHRGWCQDLFIGSCHFDGSILAGALEHRKAGIGMSFAGHLASGLTQAPGLADKILSTYGINVDNQNDDGDLYGILKLANDLFFYVPTIYMAEAWKSGSAYLYRFNSPNPWEGQWQGEAAHITDLTMLLHNFDEFLTEEQQGPGREFSHDLLTFVSAKAPWKAFDGQESSAREYGSLISDQRGSIWEILKGIDPDQLTGLLEGFLASG